MPASREFPARSIDGGRFANVGMNEEWLRWLSTALPTRKGARHPLEVEGLLVSIAVVADA